MKLGRLVVGFSLLVVLVAVQALSAPLAITSSSPLPNGAIGVSYSYTLTASGGTPPYSWYLISGTLPSGLALSAGGQITGTPTAAAAGTSTFTIGLKDSSTGNVMVGAAAEFSLTVAGPSVKITSTSPLPNGTVAVSYSYSMTASGGTPPYTWSLAGGTLPAGLSLSSSGQITGTPTAAGSSSFTIGVTDSAKANAQAQFSLTIQPKLTITSTSPLPSGTVKVSYSYAMTATGGTPPYSWSLSAGTLPAGLSLSSAGQITGTPTTAGTSSFTIGVTDSAKANAQAQFSLTINPPPASSSPSASLNVTPTSFSLSAQAGGPPTTQQLNVNSTPPGASIPFSASASITSPAPANWLTLSATSGVTPTTIGVTVNPANLTPGTYMGSVTITQSGTSSPSSTRSGRRRTSSVVQSITVPITVVVMGVSLSLAPAAMTFNYVTGGALPQSQNLEATVLGASGTIQIQASANVVTPSGGGWLVLNSGSPGQFVVSVSPAGLSAGTYVATVSVNILNSNPNISQQATVTLKITTPITLLSSAQSLTFSAQAGASPPPAQQVNISVSGVSNAFGQGFTASATPGFVSVATASSSLPAILSVTVNQSGLAAGAYAGAVLITTSGATNSPLTIQVTLNVTAGGQTPGSGGQIMLSSAPSLTFSSQPGASPPPSQQVTVSVSGGSTGQSFTASASPSFLSVNPPSGSLPAILTVAVNPSGLAAGSYPGTITIASAGAANSPYTIQVTLNVTSSPLSPSTGSGQAISHLADGGGWSTSIIQLDTDTVPANFTLNFFDGTGNPWKVPLGANGTQNTFSGTIPVFGSQTIQTAGTAVDLSAGWAQLVTTNSINGTAIFADQAPGQPISEAAVPITSSSSTRFLLPFNNSAGYALGVAVANPNTTLSAAVNIIYRDPSGNQTGISSQTVPPMAHISFVIPASAGTSGVAEFDSSVAVVGLGIRSHQNGFTTAFTSVEALSSVPAGGKTITHIADGLQAGGGSWNTSVVLVNTDTAPANFTIIFRSDAGAPLVLPLGPDGNQSQLSGTIAPGGSRTITSQGASATLVTGWAELDTTSPIGGTAIFGFQSGGTLSEASVPIIPDTHTSFVFPFDGSPGLGTGVAFANPSSSTSASLSVSFNNAAGQAIGTPVPYVVPPDGHTSVVLPVSTPGVAVVTSSTPVSALAIRSHNGAFTSIRTFGLGGN